MKEIGNTVVSNFWLFIIGSVILVATAMLLRDHPQCELVLWIEGFLSGARGIQKLIEHYLIGKQQPERLKN